MSKKIVVLALHLGTGGAEKVICNLANLLCKNHDVKIISTYKLTNTPAFKLNNKITVEYLMPNLKPNKKELSNSLKQKNFILFFKAAFKSLKILYLRKKLMVKAIKNLDCDIVFSTRIFHNNLVGKFANKKIIKIAQEHNHHNNNRKYINKVIKSVNKFDYFMPVSKELSEFYSPLVRPKVIYIPNFIEEMPSIKSSLQNKQLISVGRLDKIKGFEDLIDIFNLFHKSNPEWKLHIVGEGNEKQNLQNKINKLHLQNKIFLLGNMEPNKLEKEYLNSTIYLMTSFSESFGLVLVEAASFGLPLIAFDSAQGAKEIIKNNKNGFLIQNRNKKDFVKKINEIINNPEKKFNLSSHAITTANNFSKNNVSKIWDEFINSL